eukprot:355524-Chlamydomonas_euryale.AAC.50
MLATRPSDLERPPAQICPTLRHSYPSCGVGAVTGAYARVPHPCPASQPWKDAGLHPPLQYAVLTTDFDPGGRIMIMWSPTCCDPPDRAVKHARRLSAEPVNRCKANPPPPHQLYNMRSTHVSAYNVCLTHMSAVQRAVQLQQSVS